MRHIKTILLSLVSLSLLTSCEIFKVETIYDLNIEPSVSCSNDEQEFIVTYAINPAVNSSTVEVVATTDAEWVLDIDTSTLGSIKLTVDENSGSDSRIAKLNIKATKHKSTSIEIMQYGIPPATANHTLMYYFFGTSLGRFFKINLEHAALAIETGILGNNNRVVFFRQESKHSGYIGELCYDITTKKCNEKRIKDITLTGTLITPETIGEHIAMLAEIAPAERYGIILAGHGQGWITREILNQDSDISPSTFSVGYNPWIPAQGAEVTRAFGEDNVQVNIEELAEGIQLSNISLDYIIFDACFMSNIEAIYELRYSANYIIASPCEIMGNGFPYNHTLPHLFKDEGKRTDYVGAAESYYLYYRDEYNQMSRCGSVALYNCSKIDDLAKATSEVMKSAKREGEYSKNGLQTYEGQKIHHFYDFGEWVNIIATDSEAITQFNNAMDSCIEATFTLDSFYSAYGNYGTYPINLEVYSGVTTSAPSEAYPNGWRQTNWYKEVIELEN